MTAAILKNRVFQLLGLVLIGYIIYNGQFILVPLGFAVLISVSLLPVYRFFKKIKFPESIAILASIVLAFLLIGGIVTLISIEISSLLGDSDSLQKNIETHIQTLGSWIQQKTGLGMKQQGTLFQQQITNLKNSGGEIVKGTASSIGDILVWFGLVPVYVYLMLYYKNLLLRFIFLSIKADFHFIVEESIHDGENAIKGYLLGLMIEMVMVATMIFTGLFIFGIKYALFMAVTFAVLNMIPYIGSIIASLIVFGITLSTTNDFSDTWTALIIMLLVQIIDNNIIMTYVVSSKVKVNALVTVVAVIVGGALAGIGGMFLAIPTVAVLKVIFEKVEGMKHFGMLFGDDNPKFNPLTYPVMRLRKSLRKRKPTDDTIAEENIQATSLDSNN